MKAIRVHETGEPSVMRLEEVPDPRPGPGQVLVEIKAAGVNPVEAYVRSGKYPMKLALPYTPGTDGAGLVRAVGEGVSDFKPGDRVYIYGSITGTYAQLALCLSSQLHPLPPAISFAQGAALGVPYGTAWRALYTRAHAFAGETLLVHGASGAVGTAAVQIAKAAGLTVYGTAGTERGLKLVKEQGADFAVDHHAPDYQKQLLDQTGGRGFDLILEMLANVNLNNDLALLAKNGRVVVIGSRGPVPIDPRQSMTKETTILGMTLHAATAADLHATHAALAAGTNQRHPPARHQSGAAARRSAKIT
jgi:NADPH2:quinone reductase